MKSKNSGFGIVELIVVAVGLLLIGFVVYQFAFRSQLVKNDESALMQVNQTSYEGNDKLKWERHYGLHGLFMAHKINTKEYLPADEEAWNAFVKKYEDNDTLVDPYTGTKYVFTNEEPEYGEIQYRFPASCDEDRKQFIAANSSQSFAFRLKFSDGIRCSHSL